MYGKIAERKGVESLHLFQTCENKDTHLHSLRVTSATARSEFAGYFQSKAKLEGWGRGERWEVNTEHKLVHFQSAS